MSRRSTSLNNYTATAITREIGSKYDVVKEVSEHLEAIETLANTDIDGLIAQLEEALDFTGITVETVAEGTPASWDAETATLYVPTAKGDSGVGITSITRTAGNGSPGSTDEYTILYTDGSTSTYYVRNGSDGLNGLTPVVEFTYNEVTGDLEYEIVDYADIGVDPKLDEEW